jgi:integrase
MRSGTATRINPQDYNRTREELRFTTKFDAKVTLPVTAAIAALFEDCDQNSPEPYVWQLRRREPHGRGKVIGKHPTNTQLFRDQFNKLRKSLGIEKRIVPHDLRRTAAVAMLEQTGDVRDVQALLGHRSLLSTIWYLDHDLRPIKRSTLEQLKQPTHEEKTA